MDPAGKTNLPYYSLNVSDVSFSQSEHPGRPSSSNKILSDYLMRNSLFRDVFVISDPQLCCGLRLGILISDSRPNKEVQIPLAVLLTTTPIINSKVIHLKPTPHCCHKEGDPKE